MGAVHGLDEITACDVARVGTVGALLGELVQSGVPVPAGFVIEADAFTRAMTAAGVDGELRRLWRSRDADPAGSAVAMEAVVRGAGVPAPLATEVLDAARRLRRSSAFTVRASPTDRRASADPRPTALHVAADEELVAAISDAWASIFSQQRAPAGRDDDRVEPPAVAVIVQQFIDAERAGVMFTVDPVTADRGRVVIEAGFGLEPAIIAAEVEPDTYVVAKEGPRLLQTRVGHKDHKLAPGSRGSVRVVQLHEDDVLRRVLRDDEAVALAHLALRIEGHFAGAPQEIDWAFAAGRPIVLQVRPLPPAGPACAAVDGGNGRTLIRGVAASPGRATGRVRIVRTPLDATRVGPGDVVVGSPLGVEWSHVVDRVAAIVLDRGGPRSAAAVVARELGVPCVAGARDATSILRHREIVTVDGGAGCVVVAEPDGGERLVPSSYVERLVREVVAALTAEPATV